MNDIDEIALTLQQIAERLQLSYSTVFAMRRTIGFRLPGTRIWRVWPSRLAELGNTNNNLTRLSLRVGEVTECPSAKIKNPVSDNSTSARQACQRIRRSADTTERKAAQEYHDRLKANLWRQDKLGEAPDRTFDEAAVLFLRLGAAGLREQA